MESFEVCAERLGDVAGIRDVNIQAFRDHPISRQTEHLIVDALRAAGALALSLVAVRDDCVLGHVAFSKTEVGDSDSDWYLLGPIAVLPDWQGQGIGSALVRAGLAELQSLGAAGCVLVGDPGYYERFGFVGFPGLEHEGVPSEYVLGLRFEGVDPSGRIRSHEAFAVEPDVDLPERPLD